MSLPVRTAYTKQEERRRLWCTWAHETIILQRRWCCGTEYDTPYAKTVNVFKYECTIQNFGVCPIALMYIRIYCFYCSWVVVIGESSGIFQGRPSTALKVGTFERYIRRKTEIPQTWGPLVFRTIFLHLYRSDKSIPSSVIGFWFSRTPLAFETRLPVDPIRMQWHDVITHMLSFWSTVSA